MKTALQAREDILCKLADYATSRKKDVERGLETPELAGVLIQKYGYGLCDAFAEIFNEERVNIPIYKDVDCAVAMVDPNWHATQDARWQAKAGLDMSTPRTSLTS